MGNLLTELLERRDWLIVADVDQGKPHRCASGIGPADQVANERQAGPDVVFREWRADHHRRVDGDRLHTIGVLVDALDGKLVDLEVVQTVLPLERLGVPHARRAKVDTGHLRCRPAQGMLGRLRCPAAGNEDGPILPVAPVRPKQVVISPAPLGSGVATRRNATSVSTPPVYNSNCTAARRGAVSAR